MREHDDAWAGLAGGADGPQAWAAGRRLIAAGRGAGG
jgi:hypothetical protein